VAPYANGLSSARWCSRPNAGEAQNSTRPRARPTVATVAAAVSTFPTASTLPLHTPEAHASTIAASRAPVTSTGRERAVRAAAPAMVIATRVARARCARTAMLTDRASDHHSGATALSRQAS
jgi:hypothetical protein